MNFFTFVIHTDAPGKEYESAAINFSGKFSSKTEEQRMNPADFFQLCLLNNFYFKLVSHFSLIFYKLKHELQ